MNLAPTTSLIVGLVLVLGFGLLAFLLRLVSRSGLIGGVLVGTLVVLPLGWPGFVVLAVFFTLGSGATRLKIEAKTVEGTAQESGGRRGARHAAANGACGVLVGLVILLWPDAPSWLAVAFVGSFATALCDTLGTEIGQAYGRTTVLPTTFRRVPRGTEGALSLQGTAAGIAGAAVLGVTGAALGMYPWAAAPAPLVAGFLGSTVESYAAALRLGKTIDGNLKNAINTTVGALVAGILGALLA